MPVDVFVFRAGRRNITGIYWVESKDADKYLISATTPYLPTPKNYMATNVNRAEVVGSLGAEVEGRRNSS